MNKSIKITVLKIISIMFLTSGSFGTYISNNIVNNAIDSSSSIIEATKIIQEKAEKAEKEDKLNTIEDKQEKNVTEIKKEDFNNEKIITPHNSINISNILNSNIMNDNGDNFYLNHDINGNYDEKGVPYIDFRTNFDTRKTIIYAHSSTNGDGPFQALQNYHNNKSFYESNRNITINYNNKTYNYEIFSVYVSLADNAESEGLEYFRNMTYSDSEWEETINKYKSNSEYDTGVSVNSNDKILILQTCSMDPNYYEKYYRYNLLIMGKLI